MVSRLESLVEPWEACSSIGPSELGRNAVKAEETGTVIDRLSGLSARASSLGTALANYQSRMPLPPEFCDEHPELSVKSGQVGPTCASRLSLKGKPSFDACPVLGPALRPVFEDPRLPHLPECEQEPPPRVSHQLGGPAGEISLWRKLGLTCHIRLMLAEDSERTV